jgi:hypothetical protein
MIMIVICNGLLFFYVVLKLEAVLAQVYSVFKVIKKASEADLDV